ncbi:low molecular weight phosphatase family protein [Rhodococcus oxybenzonivorans]|uniref:Low molecular weight phosphatase family protein n=1 Tax=Rhodococcus oxybenzonivorans TaxID=1990687 RepID=A0A2S2BTN4_9NOCA|nr:low molecular weight phosphatase family protein [Rhodococcus oxybenzonivorans]AWK71928.1 low molecular weight phosphatase family protein [Rhodococcus oxybenzonivorans]
MHVLFVCSGNVCRSPIAERLTRAYAVDRGISHLTAESAGVRALVGFPIEPIAARVVEGLGASADGFTARRLRPEMIKRADLVLAMTEQLRDRSMELVLGTSHCTFTLREAHRIARDTGARTVAELAVARRDYGPIENPNISDPVGLSEAAFTQVGDQIAASLMSLLDVLDLESATNPEVDEAMCPDPAPEPEPEPEPVPTPDRAPAPTAAPTFMLPLSPRPLVAARAASSILDYPVTW